MSRSITLTNHLRKETILNGWVLAQRKDLTLKRLIFLMERIRQGGRSDKSIDAKRPRPSKLDPVSRKLFNQLIGKRLKVKSFKEFRSMRKGRLIGRMLGKRERKLAATVSANIARIYGIPLVRSYRRSVECLIKRPKLFHQWVKIRRGRDLFIKGMGTFNIAETSHLILRNVTEVRWVGYMLRDIPSLRETRRSNFYLLEIALKRPDYAQHWWKELLTHVENGTIDEINMGLSNLPNPVPLEQNPRRVITLYGAWLVEQQERRRQRMRNATGSGYEYVPPKDEDTYEQQLEDRLTPLGQLSQVKTYGELKQAAEEFRNCAAGYHERLSNKEEVIATLKTSDGKPVAMGAYNTKVKKWVQVRGVKNAKVTKDVEQVFEEVSLIGGE